ncbi:MAG: Os1348 family NHLP clan protein [Chloroflexi bacterium]|nr:Os1348 family NHLP clan protein [Chloroflexota bacterium]
MNNSIERIVGKAVLDAKFWAALVEDAEAALAKAGFSLSKTQLSRLQAGLAQHKSKSGTQSLFSNAQTDMFREFWR